MISLALVAALSPLPVTTIRWAPGGLFSGWSEDGTNVTFPISSLPGLTADTADATTGDARLVVGSFAAAAFDWYNSLVTKPGAIVVSYDPGRMQTSGTFTGTQKAVFTFTCYNDYPSGLVTAEVTE